MKSRWHKISGCTHKTGNVSTYNVTLSRVSVTNCCVEKRYYTLSVYVCSLSYEARKALVSYSVAIYGLSGCTVFLYIILQTARFSVRKFIEHKMPILIFPITLLWSISIFLRNIQLDIVINMSTCSYKVPVILVKL